jgi:hypothetical protein
VIVLMKIGPAIVTRCPAIEPWVKSLMAHATFN